MPVSVIQHMHFSKPRLWHAGINVTRGGNMDTTAGVQLGDTELLHECTDGVGHTSPLHCMVL
jgi:hypothetical protein